MEKEYELKCTIVGPEAGLSKEVRILNRRVSWIQDGIQYACDRRHADIFVCLLGMEYRHLASQKSLTVSRKKKIKKKVTPMLDWVLLKNVDLTLFFGLSRPESTMLPRIDYVAQDRADLVFANNCVSHFMSEPTPAAWQALKRIGRYLIGARRIVETFKWSEVSSHIEGYGDSDWASDKVSRRSSSGGALIWNGHVLKTWSVR